MSEQPPNGLAALTAQRERARRSMPPPRHPVTAPQKTVPPPEFPDERERAEVVSAAPTAAVVADTGAGSDATHLTNRGPDAVSETTVKVTLYVDRGADDFMEAARIAGLSARPKVDVSRSAVVRLALRRLMEHMSPIEVKALLESQPVKAGGPGRKRR